MPKNEQQSGTEIGVLIVGSQSAIGQELVKFYQRKRQISWETTRHHELLNGQRIFLDLSGNLNQFTLPSNSIKIAFICAAVTSLKKCRIDPVKSRQVNVEGSIALAKQLVNFGVFVVFISTNLVFDGLKPLAKSNDPCAPQTEYGRQKLEAESELLKLGDMVSIVRLSKVLPPDFSLFQDWIRSLKDRKEIYPFADMFMSPVSLTFAVDVLSKVAEMQIPGIFQVSAGKDISYADAALHLARNLSLDEKLIKPVSYRESGIKFAPLHTTDRKSVV